MLRNLAQLPQHVISLHFEAQHAPEDAEDHGCYQEREGELPLEPIVVAGGCVFLRWRSGARLGFRMFVGALMDGILTIVRSFVCRESGG